MNCDNCQKITDLVKEFVKMTNEFIRKMNMETPTLIAELPADIGSTVDMSYDNTDDSSIPEVKQKKGAASTSKKISNPDQLKKTKTKIEKNSITLDTRKPNTRSKSVEPSTSTRTTRTANKRKDTKGNDAADNPTTNKKGSKNNVPSVADSSSFRIDESYGNIADSSIPEVKQKKGAASTSKKSNPDQPKTTKTKIEKNSITVETRKPNTRSKSVEPSTSTKTTRTANKRKDTKGNGAIDNPTTNEKGDRNNVSSVADISSFRIDISYDNIANCSIPEIKQEAVRASASEKSNADETEKIKMKIEKNSITLETRKPNTRANSKEPSSRTTRTANKAQDTKRNDATDNPSPSKKGSKDNEQEGKGPKASSLKSGLPNNSKDDKVVGVFERRLLKQERRRMIRRSMRRERRLARAIGELSRIVSNHAQENGYLPVASQEQQDRSTLSRSDPDSSDSDSSCSCSESSCSCWMYSDSGESTDSSDFDAAVEGRSR